jgi:endonuclease III
MTRMSARKSTTKKVTRKTSANKTSASKTSADKPSAGRKAPGSASSSNGRAADRRQRAAAIYGELLKLYPDARCALNHRNPFELLIATILSAQCTDVRVNMVTPALFKRFGSPAKMAGADLAELEELIRTTGFFRNKAKSIQGAGARITAEHGGRVPDTMEALLKLPGVARKTANVVLGNAFGRSEGVVVDTHIARLSQRMDLTRHADPVKIERDLMALFPRENWTLLAHLLIHHGRAVCSARKPDCGNCPLGPQATKLCPQRGV